MDDGPKRFLALLIPVVFSTGVFLFTLAPSIYPGDSPELTAAAFTLGIPHPPGYPHYTLLGKVWTLLPFGNIAFRLNLLSAVGTGLAAGAFSWLLFHCTGSLAAAATGPLLMAFSRDIFAQSGSAEVYTLNLLCALLLLCLAAGASSRPMGEEPGDREGRHPLALFWSAAFLFGYSLGIHYFVLFVLPGILFLFHRRMGGALFLRALAGAVPAVLAGWILFLLLPIRAASHPPLNWGETSDPVNFLLHVGWGQYAGRPALGFSWSRTALRGLDLLRLIGSQWPPPIHLLLPAGLVFLWRRFRSDLLPSVLLLFFLPSLATLFLLNDPGSEIFFGISSNKFLTAYAVYALVLAAGAYQASDWIVSFGWTRPPPSAGKRVSAVAGVALCLLSAWTLCGNREGADRSRSTLLAAYTLNLLEPIPADSGMAVEYDVPTFPLLYVQYVEEYRPDLSLYGRNGILFRTDYNEAYREPAGASQEQIRRKLDSALIRRHPGRMFFSNQVAPFAPGGDAPGVPYGLVYLPADAGILSGLPDLWGDRFVTSPFRGDPRNLDHRNRELVSDMYRMTAEAEVYRGHLDNASRLLEEALAAAPGYYWIHYYAGILRYRVWGNAVEAERQLERAGRIIPSEEVPGTIGILRFETGDIPGALRYFRKALSINPAHLPSLMNAGECYLAAGERGRAEEMYRKGAGIDPGNPRVWIRLGQMQGTDARFSEAVESFTRAIGIDPSDPEAYSLRAVAEAEMGNLEDARRDLEQAKALAPSNREYDRLLRRLNAGRS